MTDNLFFTALSFKLWLIPKRMTAWALDKMPRCHYFQENIWSVEVHINLSQPVDSIAPGLHIVGLLVQTHEKEESILNWPQVMLWRWVAITAFHLGICIVFQERIEGIELFSRMDTVYGYQSSYLKILWDHWGGKGAERKHIELSIPDLQHKPSNEVSGPLPDLVVGLWWCQGEMFKR